jgi:AcrR family transcriptional regulator
MTTRRQERSAEIARAAVGPLSELGLSNARLSDIGASLGMSGAHLLYYFESKTDLFMAALRVVEKDLRDKVTDAFAGLESARERWAYLMEAGAPMGLHDSGLLMWLEGWSLAVHHEGLHKLVSELEANWLDLLGEVVTYGVQRGELPADLDVDSVIEGVSALLDGLTIRVVVGYRPLDRDAAMRILDRFVSPLLPWADPDGDA